MKADMPLNKETKPSRIILCLEVREMCTLYVHIYSPCVVVSKDLGVCIWGVHKCRYKWFTNRSIWPIDETLKILLLLIREDQGLMAMKEEYSLSRSLELVPYYLMQFSFVPRTPPHLIYLQEQQSVYSKPCW